MPIWKLVAAAFIAGAGVWAETAEGPKSTGLTESVEKRLVQLDVAVEGDRDAIRALTASDLTLFVAEREMKGLIVDPMCGDAPVHAPQDRSIEAGEPPGASLPSKRPRATFVFFLDQTHLTQAGRALSLETSRDLIRRVVVDGNRASIVSNARRLETYVPMTDRQETLLAGLERLRSDPRQWDWYAENEERRAEDVMRERNRLGGVGSEDLRRAQDPTTSIDSGTWKPPACRNIPAKTYAREEWREAWRTTERLEAVVGSLAETSAPKALVYFGDTLRQKAGAHYLRLGCPGTNEALHAESNPSAATRFDAVVAEALARGVHFFTIQAEGLLTYWPGWDAQRHDAAQDGLVKLAAETGGEAFLGGASRELIVDRIDARTSCALLLSFPPADLPRDRPLSLRYELRVTGVKIRTQGSVIVPSARSNERARLMAAFIDPTSMDDGSLRALLIPRSSDGKTWKASLQIRLQPTGLPDNSTELGASIVRGEKVTEHFAASIATKSGLRDTVLEKSLDVAPGTFSIVAVARDAKRGDIGSNRLETSWPNPAKGAASIAPVAVLQAGLAAMSRDGQASSTGPLARDTDEALDASIGMSLTTVVCRGTKTRNPVTIERWFGGGTNDDFAPMTIAPTGSPCVQTLDVIPAGRFRPGVLDYRIVARIGEEIVAQERRTLRIGTQP